MGLQHQRRRRCESWIASVTCHVTRHSPAISIERYSSVAPGSHPMWYDLEQPPASGITSSKSAARRTLIDASQSSTFDRFVVFVQVPHEPSAPPRRCDRRARKTGPQTHWSPSPAIFSSEDLLRTVTPCPPTLDLNSLTAGPSDTRLLKRHMTPYCSHQTFRYAPDALAIIHGSPGFPIVNYIPYVPSRSY
jgi:hypothetical protein